MPQIILWIHEQCYEVAFSWSSAALYIKNNFMLNVHNVIKLKELTQAPMVVWVGSED